MDERVLYFLREIGEAVVDSSFFNEVEDILRDENRLL